MEKRLVLGAACAGVVLFLAGAAHGEEADKKEVAVTGVVEVAEADDQGNTKAVGLWDEANYKWYTVAEDGKGKELFKLVGKTLKVTGTLTIVDDWERVITVLRYEEVQIENR